MISCKGNRILSPLVSRYHYLSPCTSTSSIGCTRYASLPRAKPHEDELLKGNETIPLKPNPFPTNTINLERKARTRKNADTGLFLPETEVNLSAWHKMEPRGLISSYLQLSKSKLTMLITSTAAAGYLVGTGPISVPALLACSAGTALLSAAANACNQLLEAPYDAQMKRTQSRVLVVHRFSPLHALTFAGVTSAVGCGLLYSVCNPITAYLGAVNFLLYAGVYTPLKRMHIGCTWAGALVGAIPPLMGYAAASGTLDMASLCLAGILFSWQFPHFNGLSWNLRPDYSKAGYRVMCVTNERLCRVTSLRHSLALVGLCSIAAPLTGLTTVSFAIDSLPINALLVYLSYKFYKAPDSKNSRKLFFFSLLYLPVIMLLMVIGSMSSPGWSTSPQAHPPNFPQPLNGGRFYSKEYSQYEELTSGFVQGFEEPDYEPRPSQFKFQPSTTEFSRDSSSGNRMRPTVWNEKDVRLQNGTYPTSDSQIQETDILGDETSSGEEEEKAMKHRPQLHTVSDDVVASSSEEAESDDPEVLEQIERERIIEMYEKGPENPRIDDWENPDWDVYRKTDRHGFIHKEGLSEADRAKSEKERIETEIKREKKWLSMLSQWDAKRPVKKLNERVWKGVPLKLRIRVWPKLLGIEELKAQNRGDDIYVKLVDRARLISKDIKQIDLDINRTYRDNQTFRRRYDIKQRSLLNVLAAYSMYNTEIGYCQGMSQIVALFLMFLDEEEAFWCLHALMISERHSMHGFFVPGFPKLQRFEEHFQKILKKYKPKVYKQFEKEGIPYIYLTKWWFGCFLDRVPFPLALRLWDVFLYEGDTILMAMAINIMKMHERTIRKLTLETFMEFIQSTMAEDFQFPDDEVMKSLREVLTKLISDRTQRPPPPGPGALPERPTKAFGPVLARSLKEIQDQVSELRSRSSRANSVATGRTPQSRRRNDRNYQLPATPLKKDLNTGPSPINETAIPSHQVPFQDEHSGKMVFVVRGGDNDESPTADAEVKTPKRIPQLPSAEPPGVTHSANHITYVTIGDDEDADQWISRV
ncbi:unnamed protein product, partial [Mesorhabditis belari]|uniref:Protoheme IX farnesyltransferase, mitochondrial n=1 Tax=Mesorhabditis belari TaxID=2138241 RepID=A0AAF3EWP4_9BILA